ncbi:leucine-rich repeat domain-containing protein [Winogradskyella vidalii]|uniref:leucine-rich repeat domain-containing protein n=1 Tax=Winogradskyella vidalii TaxID=2615024 RepID=UPI0015CA476F|nr:leucine-rich repeat domain-containing protein [Winogradskyella vidalii]
MEYKIIRDEDDELTVFLPYNKLFNETYNPESYSEFPEIRIIFKDTEELEKPTTQQINALEYFLKYSFKISNSISDFIYQEREVFLEATCLDIETIKNAKDNYRFSTINIRSEHKEDISYVGLTGDCSWDPEHGFGIMLFKSKIIDFGDWETGGFRFNIYDNIANKYSLEPLRDRRNRIANLSQNIQTIDTEKYLSLLKWLIDLNVVYGYRDTELDLTDKETIALIRDIKKLDLANKKLERLPNSINLFTNLEEFQLQSNNLTELPKEICQLENLKKIELQGNQLNDLPRCFRKLKNLNSLFLNNNSFNFAPDCIGELLNLRALHLSGNSISELPTSYENLTNIQIFYMSSNNFNELPIAIKTWKKLDFYHAENNQIKFMPSWIGEFTLLGNLNLNNNELTEIPTSISRLKELRFLNLRNNRLIKLPEEINNIHSIYLENNNLVSLSESIKEIKVVNIRNNDIPTEKLIQYKKWREGKPPYFRDDFDAELKRINDKKKEITRKDTKTKSESKPVINKKIGNDESNNVTKSKRVNNLYYFISVLILLSLMIYFIAEKETSANNSNVGRNLFDEKVALTYHNFYKGKVLKKYVNDNRNYVDIKFELGIMKLIFPYENQDLSDFVEIGDSIIKRKESLVLELKGKNTDTLFYFKFDKIKGYEDYSKTNEFIIDQKIKRNANNGYK